jgi:hypothetical protein
MKKALKIFGLIIIIYLSSQLITIVKYGRGLAIGFPFRVYGKVDAECYVSTYFHPEFLIINFIIIAIVVLAIYSMNKLIKSRLKRYPADRET